MSADAEIMPAEDELTLLREEVSQDALRQVQTLLQDAGAAFDFHRRMFGEGGEYEGDMPCVVDRREVTKYLVEYARTCSHSAAAQATSHPLPFWVAAQKRDKAITERLQREEAQRPVSEDVLRAPTFTEMLEVAESVHADYTYESSAQSAFEGLPEIVFSQGVPVGLRINRNARLAELILKKRHPDFREEKLADIAKGGVLVVGPTLARDEWEQKHGDD